MAANAIENIQNNAMVATLFAVNPRILAILIERARKTAIVEASSKFPVTFKMLSMTAKLEFNGASFKRIGPEKLARQAPTVAATAAKSLLRRDKYPRISFIILST
jgi:hypothetical protein